MGQRKLKKWLGLFLVCILVWGGTSTGFQQCFSFPKEMRLFAGSFKTLRLSLPTSATVSASNPDLVEINGKGHLPVRVNLKEPFILTSKKTGQAQVTLKLFGKVPFKRFRLQILPDIRVIPGGQSIGVKLRAQGMLVVGHHRVKEGEPSPGEKADIHIGDYILTINGEPIRDMNQVGFIAQKAGEADQSIRVELLHDGRRKKVTLKPEFDEREHGYRLGLYIRNSATGVGTLTFYDPERKKYGALGHVITDMDTGQPIAVGDGTIVHSNVTSIQKGASGEPGEKRAIFFQENQKLGNITQNTQFGIFGDMDRHPGGGMYQKSVPVALAEEVKEGPAQILTVVEGQKVEKYDIEIVHLIRQKYPATKGLIIKVTDPRLLKKTGGIVQGMSGSPILQNGKLAGAVTHVFVNDPSSGYGTYIEWMLQDAKVMPTRGQQGPAFL
ncbi:SpoIVB peptidase [Marinithermofilum abyssi]|uniref:SpoIVB peptidase n=1 Tax=Marinithermofilum abyssi TaxID=1571185 RepID=A0A8J2YC15_9BACL|nr:SpoIVB peptidase [Marinithermofilum abyssi]GGE10482.1 SpoIVB peptidase [Marinithermofilum abyssi]